MQIKLLTHDELLSQRTELLLEAEQLLQKIARLTIRYHGKIFKIRKKIRELENINDGTHY